MLFYKNGVILFHLFDQNHLLLFLKKILKVLQSLVKTGDSTRRVKANKFEIVT